MIVSVIHRSLSQNNREFDLFLLNFEQLLNDISTRKPAVPIITSDYNAKDLLPGGLMTSIFWKAQIYICSHPQTNFLN